jgi:FtsP/CotA-like multicopper oxidase with cupredoxin domain
MVPHQWLHEALSGAEAAGGGHHGGGGGGGSADVDLDQEAKAHAGKSICPKPSAQIIRDDFPTPQYRKSKKGRLTMRLRAAKVPTEINGQRYLTPSYNGKFPGPLMVVCPGDLLRVNVRNALDPADYAGNHPGLTNLHTHGFHVSPRRPQDNIFITIPPAGRYQHQYKIPRDHPPGAYWYHPHLHGQTNPQVFGGMAGGILMRGGVDGDPDWLDIGTRDLVFQQTALGTNGETVRPGPTGPFVPPGSEWFLNGELNPEIDIQPGELQRWRIYNLSAGSFLNMQLENQPFRVIATDGNYLPRITDRDTMLLGPASRREILVVGTDEGSSQLLNLPFTPFGAEVPGQTLATLNSSGPEVDQPLPPRRLPDTQPDLRDDKVDSHHELVYSQEPPNFFINGEQFNDDPSNVMEELKLNKTSQWTIRNTTTFWHTFHIHINDFQIIERDGEPVGGIEQEDNVTIPPGGSVTMRYRPTQFTGRFVFHCHVLGHEDNGMMGVVQVKK